MHSNDQNLDDALGHAEDSIAEIWEGLGDAQIRVSRFDNEWNAAVWENHPVGRGSARHWVEVASAWGNTPFAAIARAIAELREGSMTTETESATKGIGCTIKDAYQGYTRTGKVIADLGTHWRVDWGPNRTKIRKDRVGKKPKRQGPWWEATK